MMIDPAMRSGYASGMEKLEFAEAKRHLSRLLDRAHAGETLIIAKRGDPWARLGPLEPPEPRRPGLLEGEVGDAFFEPLPEAELEAREG